MNPFPVTASLNAIAFGNGRFTVVGNPPTILISTNGFDWTSYPNTAGLAYTGLMFRDGLFIGFGTTVTTSPDGIHWTLRWVPSANNNVLPRSIDSLTYGNGMYATVNGYSVFTSTDLTNWTAHPVDVWLWLRSITFGNGRFVALASGPGEPPAPCCPGQTPPIYSVSSTNGTDWVTNGVGFTTWAGALNIAFGNGIFVGNAGGTMFTSPDGQNWTVGPTLIDSNLHALTFGGGLFVAVGDGGRIFTSTNGTDWNLRRMAPDFALVGVAYGNGSFVVGGTGGGLLSSEDGQTWTLISRGTRQSFANATFAQGTFVTVGWPAILSSTNGTDWSGFSATNLSSINQVCYGSARFLALGAGTNITAFTSRDGFHWEPHDTGLSAGYYTPYCLASGNGIFVFGGIKWRWEAFVAVSTDGSVWSSNVLSSVGPFASLAFGNNIFVGVANSVPFLPSVGVPYTSKDGLNWTPQAFDPGYQGYHLDGVVFARGQFLGFMNDGYSEVLYSSEDGIHWSLLPGRIPLPIANIVYANGLFIAVGGNNVFTSVDSLNWVSHPTGGYYNLTAVTYGAGVFMAFGAGGTILTSGTVKDIGSPPWLWPQNFKHLPTGDTTIVVGSDTATNFALESSADLTNWQAISTTTNTVGPIEVIDSSTRGNPKRFYRAKISP